jgi:cytochrome c-type biogenesis protein CcmH
MKRLVAFFLLVLLVVPAFAVQPDEILPDPALESRARALSAQLRCLVCQNQSIDDSDAPLAKDLRLLIREHLTKGETDSQIMDYVVSRYGEYVLLKPRLSSRTIILWATPFVVLLLAALFLWRRRAPASSAEKPLSEAEKAELRQTLAKSE